MLDNHQREVKPMMLPKRTNLKTWAASLIIDFPNDNIPLLKGSDDWKNWGSVLVEQASFANNGAPSPKKYENVQLWMEDVYAAMANF